MSLTINGTTIKTPSSFNIERYNLTKSGRVASGKMTMELIAQKRKFNLEYASINQDDFQLILDLLMNPNNLFFTFGYVENGTDKTATCYVGAIPSDLLRSDTWQWTNVKFSIIEQ
jgi:hypothetical protein